MDGDVIEGADKCATARMVVFSAVPRLAKDQARSTEP